MGVDDATYGIVSAGRTMRAEEETIDVGAGSRKPTGIEGAINTPIGRMTIEANNDAGINGGASGEETSDAGARRRNPRGWKEPPTRPRGG